MIKNSKKWMQKVCMGAVLLMLAPVSKKELILYGIIFSFLFIVSALVEKYYDKEIVVLRRNNIIFEIVTIIIFAVLFKTKWSDRNIWRLLAEKIHIPENMILWAIVIAVSIAAFVGLDYLLSLLMTIVESEEKKHLIRILSSLIISGMITYCMFEDSSVLGDYGYGGIRQQGFFMILINLFIILIFELLCSLLLLSWRKGIIFSLIVCGIWAVANYYVILYHGSPLFLSELRNIKTAAQVLGGYSFSFSNVFFILLSLLLCGIKFVDIVSFDIDRKKDFRTIITSVSSMIIMIIIVSVSFIEHEGSYIGWSWKDGIANNGFFLCAMEDVKQILYPFEKPEGYDKWESINIKVDNADEMGKGNFPDIVLILNESFSNLNDSLSIQTDKDYVHDFYSISNSISGKAIVPSIGGGTNNSEFELLTSKSMFVLTQGAPFNYVNLKKANSSVVTYLEQYGYKSSALHCETGENYSRNIAYPDMGFDNILLGSEKFIFSKNGNRRWLDSDNYKNLISEYEKNKDTPQFMYLLTYQNHGGYEQNKDEEDTVHVLGDYGEYTDDINEYLSSVSLSYEAFGDLVKYFEKQDRPVIVCMVGDHEPSFVSDIMVNSTMTEEEKQIALRTVPYIIWANFDADFSSCTEYVNMVDIVPIIMKAAGLPLSYFYKEIIDLHNEFPIRTSNGIIMDKEGKIESNSAVWENSEKLREYYYLEYSSLICDKEYRREIYFNK